MPVVRTGPRSAEKVAEAAAWRKRHQLTRLSAQLKLAVSMNLRLDNELIAQVVKLGNFKSKRDAVDAAVAEFVARRNRLRMLELEGQIDFDPNWNYKHMRRRC